MDLSNISNRLVRLPEVLAITGLRRSTIYKLIAQGDFPAPYKLTRRAVAWKQSDINEWTDHLSQENQP
ncbi:MAG: Uncharacterised protein [Gammaproteobacteria bacterium]|nr:MAG: Uncharacterised protein [Gammaproteobacteria bacterium]